MDNNNNRIRIDILNSKIDELNKIQDNLYYRNLSLNWEINKYKNATLWNRIKYIFTKEVR